MSISKSFHEHAIKVPSLREGSSCTINIGDVEIVNWQRAKSLEEIEKELPSSFKQKPASQYVRLILKEKLAQRPDLGKIEETILQKLLMHKDVQDKDMIGTPLSEFEQKHFKSLVERIIGGCIVQAPFLPAIQKAQEYAKVLYTQVNVQIGTMIRFIQSHCKSSSFDGMPNLSHNTLRKAIKPYAPKIAFRRGRSNPSDIADLKLATKRKFGDNVLLV